MKNLLRSSLYLIVFAVAGIAFQISCSNSDDAILTPNQTGKLIYLKGNPGSQEIWTCDYDGSNQALIPITLPANTEFNLTNGTANPHISPDGETVFLTLRNTTDGGNCIYSWHIDGTNMQAIVNPTTQTFLMIGSVN